MIRALIVSFSIISVASAGRIVPNIKRNMIEFNQTGAAAALSERNNASINYSNVKTENDNSNEKELETVALLGTARIDNFSIEGVLSRATNKDNSNSETTSMFLNLGMELNEKLAIGFNGVHFQTKSGAAANTLGLSANLSLQKSILIGAGVNKIHINGSELGRNTIYVGAGFMKEDLAFEAILTHTPVETEGTVSLDGKNSIEVQGTVILDKFQLSPALVLAKEFLDKNSFDREKVEVQLSTELEYMLSQSSFFGASYSFISEDTEDKLDNSNDSTRKANNIQVFGRLKINKFQAIMSYSHTKSDRDFKDSSVQDSEDTNKSVSLVGTYLF